MKQVITISIVLSLLSIYANKEPDLKSDEPETAVASKKKKKKIDTAQALKVSAFITAPLSAFIGMQTIRQISSGGYTRTVDNVGVFSTLLPYVLAFASAATKQPSTTDKEEKTGKLATFIDNTTTVLGLQVITCELYSWCLLGRSFIKNSLLQGKHPFKE